MNPLSRIGIAILGLSAGAALWSGVSAAQGQPLSVPQLSGTPPASQPATENDKGDVQPTVTVEAQRRAIRDRIHTYVRQLARDPRLYDEAVARWRSPLCILVAGLTGGQGGFVLARVSDVASAAGMRVAGKGCHPNLYVVFAPRPDRVVNEWYTRDPSLFGSPSSTAIKSFLDASKSNTVRVWYDIGQVGAGGMHINIGGACYGAQVPVNCQYTGSRLQWSAVADLTSALAFVDADQLQGLQLGQVADYIAMVALSDLDVDADIGATPTILRLFKSRPADRPSALSSWDRAFLRALYDSEQESRTQLSQIEVRMARDILNARAP